MLLWVLLDVLSFLQGLNELKNQSPSPQCWWEAVTVSTGLMARTLVCWHHCQGHPVPGTCLPPGALGQESGKVEPKQCSTTEDQGPETGARGQGSREVRINHGN